MAKRALVVHPDGPKPNLGMGCKVSAVGRDVLKLEYVIIDHAGVLKIPQRSVPERADELWDTTCFEAFICRPDESYLEFNFSPSTAWASYRFEGYRDGMVPALDLPQPDIYVEREGPRLSLITYVEFPTYDLAKFSGLALSAVIEQIDGTKSYWALAHPPGKPDFHHPTCFAVMLPPPESP